MKNILSSSGATNTLKEIIIVRANNIYGIRQYPEKLISTSIVNIIKNKPIPIHGNGKNIRFYLSAEDFDVLIDPADMIKPSKK